MSGWRFGMKKVITYGSFDLFHEGHYNLLKRAKALGDYLIVGVTTEQYDESRGKLNVVDSLIERIDNVRKTGFVDEVVVEDHAGQKIEDILRFGIDIFTVGSDWTGNFDYLKAYCEVVYLERTKNVSSTLLRLQNREILKIGVIGTGRIAKRFVPEVRHISGAELYSVYNPHIESAEAYAKWFELGLATDDIETFMKDIDAVYVASPHETHYDYVKTALEHGKHVLCEKPMVFRRSQAEELYQLAKDKKCVLMEAVKTAYAPGFNQMISIAKSGLIGEIRDVEACFTKLTGKGVREMTDQVYGGGFTELASYTLLPIIKLLGRDYKEIRFDSIPAENGIDLYTKATFIYDNAFALSKTGLGVKSEGQLLISGTKGYILAESPWWLTQFFEVRFEDPNKREKHFAKFLGNGLRYEISDFVYMINGHQGRAYKFTRGESIAMAGIMEKFLKNREEGRNQ